MEGAHILIVDDDKAILELISGFLKEYDYKVSTATDAAAMEEVLKRSSCDLIVLDLKLPDADGLTLARRLRLSSNIPIIMLTALGSDVDRIVGLELGADDYLGKPFNPRELLARIRAVLRRVGSGFRSEPVVKPGHEALGFASWILDVTARQLLSPEGELVDLTSGEFNLLEAFVRSPHHVLSRDQLLAMTRLLDTDVFDRTIDVLILRLRRKLETNPKQPKLIKTERGAGYVFAADVKRLRQ
jgi:two-component system OmpR family response regulator